MYNTKLTLVCYKLQADTTRQLTFLAKEKDKTFFLLKIKIQLLYLNTTKFLTLI